MARRKGKHKSKRQDGRHVHGRQEANLQETVQPNKAQWDLSLSFHYNDDGETPSLITVTLLYLSVYIHYYSLTVIIPLKNFVCLPLK